MMKPDSLSSALLGSLLLCAVSCVAWAEEEALNNAYFEELLMQQIQEKKQAQKQKEAQQPPLTIVNPQEYMPEKLRPFDGSAKNTEAFEHLLEQSMPLSPDQLMYMRKLQDLTQQAVATSPHAPPAPLSSTQTLSLEPGATPPVVRIAAGFVSSLVFVDNTGASWPLTAYGLGDPTAFNVQWDHNSNAIFIQGMKSYANGNLAIRLKDLNTPIMISLVSGQKEVDFRVDLQIPAAGPNAALTAIQQSHTDPKIHSLLIQLLDGVPPEGARSLEISPHYGQAWLYKKKLYVRTNTPLISPSWLASVSGADGTRVYEMMPTPILLGSSNGKTTRIHVKGYAS